MLSQAGSAVIAAATHAHVPPAPFAAILACPLCPPPMNRMIHDKYVQYCPEHRPLSMPICASCNRPPHKTNYDFTTAPIPTMTDKTSIQPGNSMVMSGKHLKKTRECPHCHLVVPWFRRRCPNDECENSKDNVAKQRKELKEKQKAELKAAIADFPIELKEQPPATVRPARTPRSRKRVADRLIQEIDAEEKKEKREAKKKNKQQPSHEVNRMKSMIDDYAAEEIFRQRGQALFDKIGITDKPFNNTIARFALG